MSNFIQIFESDAFYNISSYKKHSFSWKEIRTKKNSQLTNKIIKLNTKNKNKKQKDKVNRELT